MSPIVRNTVSQLIIILVTLFGCVYYWVALLDSQKVELDEARLRGELRGQQINEAVDQELDATLRSVDTALRHLRAVYLHDRKNFDRSAQDVLAAYPQGMLEYVTVFGPDGYLVYSSNQQADTLPSRMYFGDREHFQVHANSGEDRLFISKPIIGRITGIHLIQNTRPIREGKRFMGVIGIPIRPEFLAKNMWSLHVNPNDLISIVREDGSIIARSRNLDEGLKLKTPADRPFMHTHNGEHGIYRDISIADKVPLLFSWRHLANYPLITITAIDEVAELGEISTQQSEAKKRTLLAMFLILAFACWISILIIKIKRKNSEISLAETQLKQIIKEQNAILDNDIVGIVKLQNRIIVWVNRAYENIVGYSSSELIGSDTRKVFFHQEEYEEMGRKAYPILQAGEHFRGEQKYRRKDGSFLWAELNSMQIDPEKHESLWAIFDITERKHTEEALRESEARLRVMLDNDLIGIVTVKDRIIQWTNPAFEKLMGYARPLVSG